MQPVGMVYAGQDAANAVINLNFGNSTSDFAILGIEPSGLITNIVPDRATFERNIGTPGSPIIAEGNGRYRLNIDLNHQGWSGIVLVTGQGPFDADLVAPPVGSRGPSWRDQFLGRAGERAWRVEMVWFESVNRQQGDSAPPPATPAALQAPPAEPAPADSGEDGAKPE
jgi:serine/threonine-protein kinase